MFRRALGRAVGGGLPGAVAGIAQVLSMMWVVSDAFVAVFVRSIFFFFFFFFFFLFFFDLGSCAHLRWFYFARSCAKIISTYPPKRTAHRDKLSISIRIVVHTDARHPLWNG